MNLKPLGDRVVVKPSEPEEVTKGGIILPDTAKEKPVEGEIIAVGPGESPMTAKRLQWSLKLAIRYCTASTAELK